MSSHHQPARDAVTVGIDGSGGDRSAIAWALRVAQAHHLPVRLLHAHPHAYDLTVSDRIRSAAALAKSLNPDVTVRTVATTGQALEVLLEESARTRMLVVAPHAGGPLDGFGRGTTAPLAAVADCPVVAVPRTPRRGGNEHGPVVVGVDGSTVSEAPLAFAFEHAAAVGAELTAVHCWQDGGGDTASGRLDGIGWEPVLEAEQRVLAERLAGWQERYPQVVVHRAVAHGRPARALIVRAATAQLLIVGSSGRAGLSGLLHGSTSQALLYESPCPLAIVRRYADAPGTG